MNMQKDIEVLEREGITQALSKFQGAIKNIDLNSSVKVTTTKGGSYTFKYATLGAILDGIRKPLADNGLSFSQRAEGCEWVTTIMHSSGDNISSRLPLPPLTKKIESKTDEVINMTPQEMGSVFTYFRRYGLVVALGICAEEDDDANIAQGNEVEKKAYVKDDYYVSEKTGGIRYKDNWYNNQEGDLMKQAKAQGKDLDKAAEYILKTREQNSHDSVTNISPDLDNVFYRD